MPQPLAAGNATARALQQAPDVTTFTSVAAGVLTVLAFNFTIVLLSVGVFMLWYWRTNRWRYLLTREPVKPDAPQGAADVDEHGNRGPLPAPSSWLDPRTHMSTWTRATRLFRLYPLEASEQLVAGREGTLYLNFLLELIYAFLILALLGVIVLMPLVRGVVCGCWYPRRCAHVRACAQHAAPGGGRRAGHYLRRVLPNHCPKSAAGVGRAVGALRGVSLGGGSIRDRDLSVRWRSWGRCPWHSRTG